MTEALLRLRLSAGYPGRPEVLRRVELDIYPGEVLGLAGGSGGGKSTIALAILGLLGYRGGECSGEILFRGCDLLTLGKTGMRRLRGREIALVPQNPLAALNPNVRLGAQLDEAWRAHRTGKPDWKPLLESVSLPPEATFLRLYPRNLSMGMAQRFLIAMAVLHRPALVLADEPTSALDSITQSEILKLFRDLNLAHQTAMLYVSHDLASMAALCHRVAILHEGTVVECAPAAEVFQNPRHPYTRRLVDALPKLDLYSVSEQGQ